MFIIKFILVMLAMVAADICWTMYFIETEKRRSVPAGMWSMAILLFGSLVTMNYVDDHRLLIAAVIGSFVGVYGTIEWKKRKEIKNK
jgi:lipid-A-disaccharide synthase-like uncharacterized protein